jgi:hypothetical protein
MGKFQVVQGGADFIVQGIKQKVAERGSVPFSQIFPQKWGILPLKVSKGYYTNPEIYQGYTNNYVLENVFSLLKVANAYNFQYAIYSALSQSDPFMALGSAPLYYYERSTQTYELNVSVIRELTSKSGGVWLTPTPLVASTWLNNALGGIAGLLNKVPWLKLPQNVYFGPGLPDAFNLGAASANYGLNVFDNTATPIASIPFSRAVIGAPVYVSGPTQVGGSEVCGGLQLAGFVADVDLVGESYTLTVPTPIGDETVVSPGFATFTIRLPPRDWSLERVAEWFSGRDITDRYLALVIALGAFVSAVLRVVTSMTGEECAKIVSEQWDASLEDMGRAEDTLARELVETYCKGIPAEEEEEWP